MGVPWCTPKMVGLQWKVHENMDDFGGNLVDTLWIKWMDVDGIPKKTVPLFKKGTQLPTMDPNLKVATDSTSCNFKARPLESPKDRFPSDIPSISDLLLVDILR